MASSATTAGKTSDTPTKPKEKHSNKSGPTKKGVKSSSSEDKLDALLHNVTEMQGSLTQLASDFYGDEPSQPSSRAFRRGHMFQGATQSGHHGYDNYANWSKNYHDYDDDLYDDGQYSHDYPYQEDDYEDDDEYIEQDDYYDERDVPDYDFGPQPLRHVVTSTPIGKPCPSPPKRPRLAPSDPTQENNASGGAANPNGEVGQEHSVNKEMDAIAAEYEGTKPRVLEDATTDPMPQQLASTLETWMWKRYNTDEIKKTQEKARRCKNADALIPLRIEEEIFHALSQRGRAVDARYHFIQNALMKGCQPIANVWQKIITGITHLQRHRQDDNPFLVITPDFSLDINQIKAELDLGLRLLGMANSQLALRRRLTMKRYLAPGFKRLCDEHNDINQWMFGGNIKATIDDVSKINRMVLDASQSYQYQYRGRGRGFLGGRPRGSRGGYFRAGRRGPGRGGFRGRGGRGFSSPQNHQGGRGRSQKAPQHNN